MCEQIPQDDARVFAPRHPERPTATGLAHGMVGAGRALNPNVDRRPVADHLSNLESLVGALESELEILAGRLEPVLQPAGPLPQPPPQEQPETSTIAHRIMILGEQVTKYTMIVHQFTARLEV